MSDALSDGSVANRFFPIQLNFYEHVYRFFLFLFVIYYVKTVKGTKEFEIRC